MIVPLLCLLDNRARKWSLAAASQTKSNSTAPLIDLVQAQVCRCGVVVSINCRCLASPYCRCLKQAHLHVRANVAAVRQQLDGDCGAKVDGLPQHRVI